MGPTIPFKQPAVTIPPGFVVLEPYGEASSGGEPPTGYGYSDVYAESYDASGRLLVPKWGKNKFITLNTPGDTELRFDATFTANLP